MTNRFKKVLFVACSVGVTAVAFLLADSYSNWFSRKGDYLIDQDTARQHEVKFPEPQLFHGMLIDNHHVVENEVKRNQRFTDLLKGYEVDSKILRQLALVPRTVFDFRKIVARKKYSLVYQNDSVKTIRALVYEPNPIDYYIFHLRDTLLIESCQREVITEVKSIAGVITSSLSETIEALGISHELTNKFVDIYAWQVDFQRLQKGDKFKLIYQENRVEDKVIGIGQIEGSYFEHVGNGFYAFPFDQGEGVDYFDEEGNSLRKALLKYPIEFTRISSRYNPNRFHPVAKVFRAHRGTDFAAPAGTPIRSVGDGIVEEAQYKTNNGNYVKIRHNNTYTTGYLHMSKIAAGIRPGARVRQGQTIGYVGRTGLATGDHLCYRFWKNGIQVDALKVQLPPAQPVKGERFPDFELIKMDRMHKLQTIPFPTSSSDLALMEPIH